MKEKVKIDKKEIIGTPIKTYKLPLKKRVAYHYTFFVFVFWGIVTACIVAPTIMANYTNLWYYLLLSPVLLFCGLAVWGFVQWWYYRIRYKVCREHESQSKNHLETSVGENGKGKTLSEMNIMYWRAETANQNLNWKYWKLCRELRDPEYKPSLDEKEIIGSFKATNEGKGIPNFMTFPPAYSEKYRRFSYKLEVGHLKQLKRIPFLWRGLLDEGGAILNIEKVNDRAQNVDGATDMEDFAKDMRHFADFGFGLTEQNPGNIYLPFRAVSCENRRMEGCEWVLKPRFLLWIFNHLQDYFLRKMKLWHSVVFGKFMDKFEEFIGYCGFWKIGYKSLGNQVLGKAEKGNITVSILQEGKTKYIYLPRANELIYQTRAFRGAYKALNQKIEVEPWESLYLSPAEVRKVLKAENLSKKSDKKN